MGEWQGEGRAEDDAELQVAQVVVQVTRNGVPNVETVQIILNFDLSIQVLPADFAMEIGLVATEGLLVSSHSFEVALEVNERYVVAA